MTQYFMQKPDSPSDRQQITTRIHGVDLLFVSDSQVFSRKHIDFGTRLLISTTINDLTDRKAGRGRLLDLGCGYGVVGIVMKRVFPAMDVVLVDINERAVELARENAAANRCKFLQIDSSDAFNSVEGTFDVIMTNPPVRAGKATIFLFYEGSFERLAPGGALYVVLQKKQGAASSLKKLEELFHSCEVLGKDSGYWVMRAIKAV